MSLKEVVSIKEILEILQSTDCEKKLRKKTLIAFVLDASKPKKVQGQGDYMQTLKIMDESYNGYLTLFYFYKEQHEVGPFETVGDIVYLKRYHYSLFNGEPQARRNSYKTSKLILFDALSLTLKFNPNESCPISAEETEYINKVSEFSKSFFGQNSLLTHYWYGSSYSIYDVMLQINSYQNNVTILNDSKNDLYSISSKGLVRNQLPIGTVLKIRNIQISLQNEILVTEKSNLMVLPDFCLDSQQYNTIQQTFTKIDITQEQYEQMTIESITQIKKKYKNYQQTSILKLINRDMKDNFVVIQGQIQSVFPTSIKDALIFYNRIKSYSYSQAIENNLQIQGMQHTVQMQINLRDESLYGTNYVLQLLVFGVDEFLPFPILLDNIEYLELEYQKVLEKLILPSDSSQLNDFVIEIIDSTEVPMFRIIDTKIVF